MTLTTNPKARTKRGTKVGVGKANLAQARLRVAKDQVEKERVPKVEVGELREDHTRVVDIEEDME